MEAKITKYIKDHLAGDYQIWFIVILLNIFGLLIQFSTKSRMTMSGPFEPLTSIVKTIIILIGSFYLMSWISRQNYIKITRFRRSVSVRLVTYFTRLLETSGVPDGVTAVTLRSCWTTLLTEFVEFTSTRSSLVLALQT